MHRPLLSILVTFRNAARWLGCCLSSLRWRDGEDWYEVLLFDDGSRDDGLAIARDHAGRDRRLRLVGCGDVGRVEALRRVFELAGGELVWVLDADDWAVMGGVRMAANVMAGARGHAALVGAYREWHEGVGGGGVGSAVRFGSWDGDALLEGRGFWLFHPLMRADAVRAAGGIADVAGAEDYDLALRLEELPGFRAVRTSALLWWRRVHGGQFGVASRDVQSAGVAVAVARARERRRR